MPREKGEARPPGQVGSIISHWGGRVVMALLPLLVVAAVVCGGFGYTTISEVIVGAILLIVTGAALEPLWERSHGHGSERWR
ncbi:MAG: hypothetical protein ACYCYK_08895 [Candidatus Dormibacteria bacterium]